MSTRRGDPFAELISPRQLMLNRLADTGHLPPSRLSANTRPAPLPVDIFAADEQLLVVLDLGGADTASITVETTPLWLTVSATFPPPPEPPPLRYTYGASCCGTVTRQVELPAAVLPESAQTRLEGGRLSISLRKEPTTRVPLRQADV